MNLAHCFSTDYRTARDRFRRAAREAGASLEALPIEARGPGGEPLTVDIARLGAEDARAVVLHTSGLHGVEAFAGSAVQLAALTQRPRPPHGCALVLVHVLNPYGMAWLRRVNEGNVDLNRNFVREEERTADAPALYHRLDPLLNPPAAPSPDAFLLRLGAFALRHGLRPTRQAIAGGQFAYPRGLFYGGAALERGPALFLDWLRARLGRATCLLALDLHTGLGPHGRDTLFLEPGVQATPADALARALRRRLVDPAADAAAYRIRGCMGAALPRALPAARVDFVLQEIGTRPALAVLRALREENRCHHYAAAGPDHPAKRALLEALNPASPPWRERALACGLGLLRAGTDWLFGAGAP